MDQVPFRVKVAKVIAHGGWDSTHGKVLASDEVRNLKPTLHNREFKERRKRAESIVMFRMLQYPASRLAVSNRIPLCAGLIPGVKFFSA